MKYLFTAIVSKKVLNNLMIYADLFERGKVLGNAVQIEIESPDQIDQKKVPLLIDHLRKGLEESGNYVSFISLDSIPSVPYWNKEVRVISNGSKFFKLCDFIEMSYPYLELEIDNSYFITNIKMKGLMTEQLTVAPTTEQEKRERIDELYKEKGLLLAKYGLFGGGDEVQKAHQRINDELLSLGVDPNS